MLPKLRIMKSLFYIKTTSNECDEKKINRGTDTECNIFVTVTNGDNAPELLRKVMPKYTG